MLYKQVDVCPCNMGQIEVLEEDKWLKEEYKKKKGCY